MTPDEKDRYRRFHARRLGLKKRCSPADMSLMTLALEKLFVITAGGGLGWGLFAARWKVGPKPKLTDSWNRRFVDSSSRDIRVGAVVVGVSLVCLAIVRLVGS